MAYRLDEGFIYAVAPKFSGKAAKDQRAIVSAIAPEFQSILATYGITSRLRIAHFMAQVTHECAGFRTTQEFASGAAYEGRKDLGNTQRGDGKRYKGRGLLQLTGRANYRDMGKKLGLDLEDNPELAADPVTSLRIACEYWKSRSINAKADKDDIRAVTRSVNGGYNGLEDRRNYLKKAKAALDAMKPSAPPKPAEPEPTPVTSMAMSKGDRGPLVGELQKNLDTLDYYSGPINGEFDDATEEAVKAFQAHKKLKADGIVGLRTSKAIADALTAPRLEEAKRNIPPTAPAAVKEKTGLWQWLVGIAGSAGAGLSGVFGAPWQTVVAVGGLALVFLVVVFFMRRQIVEAFKEINAGERS